MNNPYPVSASFAGVLIGYPGCETIEYRIVFTIAQATAESQGWID
jgi:hypothetical protein